MSLSNGFICAAVMASLTIVGCASAPKPEARVVSSGAAIRGATEAGAETVPKASLHLKLAKEQRDQALALIRDGENAKAERALRRAEADAELAIALAREAGAKAEAEKVMAEVADLKKKAAQ